jgi:hypothetical protein
MYASDIIEVRDDLLQQKQDGQISGTVQANLTKIRECLLLVHAEKPDHFSVVDVDHVIDPIVSKLSSWDQGKQDELDNYEYAVGQLEEHSVSETTELVEPYLLESWVKDQAAENSLISCQYSNLADYVDWAGYIAQITCDWPTIDTPEGEFIAVNPDDVD